MVRIEPLQVPHAKDRLAKAIGYLALASRRFHGQNFNHKCDFWGHGLLKAFIKPEFFNTAPVCPIGHGIDK